jgi:hypothetical protein
MSLPKYFNNPYFQPRHQLLHQKMNPALKMLSEVCQASQSFLILWDEDYQQLYDLKDANPIQLNIDCNLFKSRFSKLNQEVVYVPNVRYHTLFQNIDFFSTYTSSEQLLILSLLDENNKAKGLVGIVLDSSNQIQSIDFDTQIKQLDAVGTYINGLYKDYLDSNKSGLPRHLNLENLPASFFEIEFDHNQELQSYNFSKQLIRKHPAFELDISTEKRVCKLLNMSLVDFYGLISKLKDKQTVEFVYACVNAKAEKKYFLIKLHISAIGSGQYRCLGVLEDFNVQKAYMNVLDQVIFDISHVMRRPVVTMKGLTNLMDMEKLEKKDLKEITEKIKMVSNEMEEYIRAKFKIYEAKQEAVYHL